MRRQVVALLLASLAGTSIARAQPMMGGGGGMPNLAGVVGRPLPDAGMPTGTVSVRVARKMPANAAADVEVSATIKNAGGDLRRRSTKTDASGRALFEGLVPGDEFKATVTVDGEKLETQISLRGGMASLEALRREIHLRQGNIAAQLQPFLEKQP